MTAATGTRARRSAGLLGKMGKSLKNAVTPDEICAEYGADTLRLYEMAMGPLDVSRPWDTRAVVGQYRLLQRLWRNVVDEATGEVTVADAEAGRGHPARPAQGDRRRHARTWTGLRFNTAIAKITELNNHLTKAGGRGAALGRRAAGAAGRAAGPAHRRGAVAQAGPHRSSVVHQDFPVADPAYVVDETVTCVVQIKGKVKARLEVSPVDLRGGAGEAGAGRRGRRRGAGRGGYPEGDRAGAEAGEHRSCLAGRFEAVAGRRQAAGRVLVVACGFPVRAGRGVPVEPAPARSVYGGRDA